jgi:hypothetical protein
MDGKFYNIPDESLAEYEVTAEEAQELVSS